MPITQTFDYVRARKNRAIQIRALRAFRELDPLVRMLGPSAPPKLITAWAALSDLVPRKFIERREAALFASEEKTDERQAV